VDHEATCLVAEEYLHPLLEADVDTLVLGCTHYPLLKGIIAGVLGNGVTLIDSAEETARETAAVLRDECLSAATNADPRHRFVASDDPLMFLQLGQRFLGDAIESVEVKTLG
jgi:glutamate racemase